MYLRFRSSQIYAPKSDGTFEELYRQIHGRLPDEIKPQNKPNFKVQIYLVKSEWVNGKPKQIYIGVIANIKAFIDKNKKIIIDDEIWRNIRERLSYYGVLLEKQDTLLKKIEYYFTALEESFSTTKLSSTKNKVRGEVVRKQNLTS